MQLIISGSQFGDEGKGKYTDLFSKDAYAVVRYQGGPHTGHTVAVGADVFRFVQIPAGVLFGAKGVLGNGCVIEPVGLLSEIERLEESGLKCEILISPKCHIVMPYHRAQDEVMERWRGTEIATVVGTGIESGLGRLGSTKKGVGPCREDKIARVGIRVVDLLDTHSLRNRLEKLVELKRGLIEKVFATSIHDLECYEETDWNVDKLTDVLIECGERLAPSIGDVSEFLGDARRENKYVVFEGAQSVGLDVEHGTYPFCSSGYSSANGVCVGSGSPPSASFTVCAVVKAYTTQVGGGPLPTELSGDLADHIVERGKEFGTVTGRRRRVGWLDLCTLRTAIQVDGPDYICIGCLDVLAGLSEVKVATHYDIDGEKAMLYPPRLSIAARAKPVYKVFPGWPDVDWSRVAQIGMSALPQNAQEYVAYISDALQVKVAAVGVGPRREDSIVLQHPLEGFTNRT